MQEKRYEPYIKGKCGFARVLVGKINENELQQHN
jgi:hypothetical protein